ncbi:MAG: GntR family transcriptional regulator [Streptosporangiales bacterium]|nr:GntR family transcriptional regulator [Streptosporangiales bacterium]
MRAPASTVSLLSTADKRYGQDLVAERTPAVSDSGVSGASARAPRITNPPSLVELALETLRRMILRGDLAPGARVVENQLTHELGISRPPLREALRLLEQEGLIVSQPRRGAIVMPLTLHDVYEIFTMRRELERLAVRLGIPVRDPARLERSRAALAAMVEAAEADDAAMLAERAFEFHVSVIGLAGHRRLEDAYRRMQMQMLLCIALNRRARHDMENLFEDVARHRRLLKKIEAGDPAVVLEELRNHGDRTFLVGIEERLDGHSDVALEWLAAVRAGRDV